MNKVKDIKAVGAAILERRNRLGLSQAEAAGLCNVGIRFLSDLENGKETAHIGLVFRVLHGLGLEVLLSKRGYNR